LWDKRPESNRCLRVFSPTLSMSYILLCLHSAEHEIGDRIAPAGISTSPDTFGLQGGERRFFWFVIPGRGEAASPESITTGLTGDTAVEIIPIRILFIDQSRLPIAPPFLEFFLASDRAYGVIENLKQDQLVDPVSLRESRHDLDLVLMDTSNEVVRYTNVQRAVFLTRQDVDVVRHSIGLWLWIPGSALRAAPE
jgi:hypothetical protein